ncbi:MAG: preprotein translocase subunit SecE [Clostridium sp.]|jgi:preprotein translocase subunit SecE|nr:preprotein translocase subunit SecE [Clostridium sp.]CCZ17956.1 preprotein translocase SecE subunit [Clostridium sp. CAG:780]
MPKEAKNKNNKVKESKTKRHFFKDVKAELKKVIWPTKKQLVNNTVAVISIVLIVGIAVFVLDVCLEKINSFGVNKLKTIVQSTQTNEISENTEIENLISENSETQESTEADAEVTE